MLRMSRLTDYGTLVLSCMASGPESLHSAADVAGRVRLAPPTVSKILKLLARAGLVNSVRGVQGGYVLARSPEHITAADIIDALEGPVALTECSIEHNQCELESVCNVGSAWQRVNFSIRRALQDITLDQLVSSGGQPLPRIKLDGALPHAQKLHN